MRLSELPKAIFGGAGVFAFLALHGRALAEPQPEAGIGLPRDVSLDGHRIDWLIEITMIFCAILFVIMVIWMWYACVRHNANHEAEYEHGTSRHHVTVALVISALIFVVVDGNLFYHSTKDLGEAFWNFGHAEGHKDAVRIEVNAHQWAWDARYSGPDGQFNTPDDIVTLNDVRVPVDTPVIIQLASTDVIHSFYLPNLRQKQDAIPGMINRFWFEATVAGDYEIACAQHCGTHHYKMRGVLKVLPREEWERWAAEASTNSSLSYDPKDQEAHWGWNWREI